MTGSVGSCRSFGSYAKLSNHSRNCASDASGSGIVIENADKKYILTNNHVIDPYRKVDVTLGSRKLKDVKVHAIDVLADLAILGPIRESKLPAALKMGDGKQVEQGDELFLVGFPDEVQSDEDDDLSATISKGIVSRIRTSKEFGQKYFQTDAAITGGQSGGGLFTGKGELVGVSGLSFNEDFALVLSGQNVRDSVTRMLKKPAIPKGLFSLPAGPDDKSAPSATSGTVTFPRAFSSAQSLHLAPADEDRTLNLTVDMAAKPAVSVSGYRGYEEPEMLAVSATFGEVTTQLTNELIAQVATKVPEAKSAMKTQAAAVLQQLADLPAAVKATETSPGVFAIPIAAGQSADLEITIGSVPGPVSIAWTADLPMTLFPGEPAEKQLEVGATVTETIDGYVVGIDYLVELKKDQRIEVWARSPQGDPVVTVYPNAEPPTELSEIIESTLGASTSESLGPKSFDDAQGGVLGLDARGIYEATSDGIHRIRLATNDATPSVVKFSLIDCAKKTCKVK